LIYENLWFSVFLRIKQVQKLNLSIEVPCGKAEFSLANIYWLRYR